MGPIDLIRHPLIFCGITIPEFIRWYFIGEPKRIVLKYIEYFRAFWEIFSPIFLLRTLFSPWKQIKDSYPQSILHFGPWMEALTLNITTRVIGFIFRIVAFVIGLIAQILLFVGFLGFLIIWIGFPVIFWIGLTYILTAFA